MHQPLLLSCPWNAASPSALAEGYSRAVGQVSKGTRHSNDGFVELANGSNWPSAVFRAQPFLILFAFSVPTLMSVDYSQFVDTATCGCKHRIDARTGRWVFSTWCADFCPES